MSMIYENFLQDLFVDFYMLFKIKTGKFRSFINNYNYLSSKKDTIHFLLEEIKLQVFIVMNL